MSIELQNPCPKKEWHTQAKLKHCSTKVIARSQ